MIERVGISLLSLLQRTWRIRVRGEIPSSGVVAFWHGEMLPVWAFFAGRNGVALVSHSRDGERLARLLERWGYHCVRGSSSRGGRESLEALITFARQGRLVLITPDGPRGPRGVVKRGAVLCAQHAQVPLYWCTVRCRWALRFERSWDRFLLPLPFARIELEFSEPMAVLPALGNDAILALCDQIQGRFAPEE
ncbi:MAG: hypothetical protein KatS3mg038_0016 [Candidatus Kapaibacterium sp.]|nr:MAG: hypothetical protein KatS3mg038_0016 [Candidatus Kapabacteria bacterium]